MKKQMNKWFFLLLIFIGFFVSFRIYQVLNVWKIDKEPYFILGSEPYQKERIDEIKIAMVGDALYHDGVYKDGYRNGSYSFEKQLTQIKPILKEYDLAYYNQESILGGTSLGLSSYPRFNSPQEVGDAFVSSGFNLVSTANNHSLDRGENAILSSVNYWRGKDNVLMSGTCDSFSCSDEIKVGEKNNISYAFLSYTTLTNGLKAPEGKEYLVNLYSEERAKSDIGKVKGQVDVILVAMHWGGEYQNTPNEEQKKIAQYLASLGVNIVIGTHPHVVQAIEKIDDTLVFYSLGNFISAQTGIDRLIGLFGGVTIQKKTIGDSVVISIPKIEAMLTYTSYDAHFRNFEVVPYQQIDASILKKYQMKFEEKKNLVTSLGFNVHWLV